MPYTDKADPTIHKETHFCPYMESVDSVYWHGNVITASLLKQLRNFHMNLRVKQLVHVCSLDI